MQFRAQLFKADLISLLEPIKSSVLLSFAEKMTET